MNPRVMTTLACVWGLWRVQCIAAGLEGNVLLAVFVLDL